MHIAVIGAGIAGLTCARRLQAQGNSVVIYEKNEEVSGRMSTRQTELGGFDHGAQYFTAGTGAFKKQAGAWRKAGLVAPWGGKLVSLEQGRAKPAGRASDDSQQRLVGVPGMGAIGRQLAQSLDVRTGQPVTGIEAHDGQWLLRVRSATVPIAASAGPFDAVVIAVPADQAVPLLDAAPGWPEQVQQARLDPCWSIMLGFQDTLGLGYDGAWVKGSRLGWIARDASKPQRRPGEHWVGHATPAWSIEHFEDDPERAKEKLLKAFHEATGSQVQPVYVSVQRWPYAQASTPLAEDCLWDPALRLGACGDWFACGLAGSGRIENAWLSGTALAGAMGAAQAG
jgi:renalase